MAKCTANVKRGYSEKEGPFVKTLDKCTTIIWSSTTAVFWEGGGGGIYWQPCTQGIEGKVLYMGI